MNLGVRYDIRLRIPFFSTPVYGFWGTARRDPGGRDLSRFSSGNNGEILDDLGGRWYRLHFLTQELRVRWREATFCLGKRHEQRASLKVRLPCH